MSYLLEASSALLAYCTYPHMGVQRVIQAGNIYMLLVQAQKNPPPS